jgi:hypothetical protein
MIGMRLNLVLVALALAFAVPSAWGRLRPDWPYKKLVDEADLVVLATAEATKPAKDDFDDNTWPLEIVGQETTFRVAHVLKGEAPKEPITVLHFKFGAPKKGARRNPVIRNGPQFVAFRTQDVLVDTVDQERNRITMPRPEYLLFLKLRKDGRYEPVSGQLDPDLSVREVSPPLSDLAGK